MRKFYEDENLRGEADAQLSMLQKDIGLSCYLQSRTSGDDYQAKISR